MWDIWCLTEYLLYMSYIKRLMDAGMYDVMKAAIPFFWERLNTGGIMIFDQYSTEFAPGETLALHELLPDVTIHTIPHSWMPNAYIIK